MEGKTRSALTGLVIHSCLWWKVAEARKLPDGDDGRVCGGG